MTIKDKLNLQKNTLEILKKGCLLFLTTEKGLKLEVKLIKDLCSEVEE